MKPAIKSRFKPLATHLHGAFLFPHISSFSQLRLNLSHLRLENTDEDRQILPSFPFCGIIRAMSDSAKIVEFISFCIEMYARQRRISGGAVADLLLRAGGYEYLRNGYEVLHTMGSEWLVEDLDELFKRRGVAA